MAFNTEVKNYQNEQHNFKLRLAILGLLVVVCFGLLAEVMMRTYHESQGKPIYRVREVFGSK